MRRDGSSPRTLLAQTLRSLVVDLDLKIFDRAPTLSNWLFLQPQRADERRRSAQHGGVRSIGWLGIAVCQTKCNTPIARRGRAGDTADFLIRQEGVANMRYHQLSDHERYAIARFRRQGYSLRAVANLLARAPSTISRELRRNATHHDGHYRPEKACQYTLARRRRSRRNQRYGPRDWAPIATAIRRKWSPAQIAGRAEHLHQPCMSTETIYRYLRLDRRHGGELWRNLRIVAKFGRKRRGSPPTRGRLLGKRHISERPKHVENRRQHGHWEGDTVIGADLRHCVLTLVERVTGFIIIKKLKARSMAEATQALTRAIRHCAAPFKSVTLDNGTEFHDYETVEKRTGVPFYFATPYHSWERGTNENTNGLVRQYLPKGLCLKTLTQTECNQIAKALNERPRDRLGFKTPGEVLFSRS